MDTALGLLLLIGVALVLAGFGYLYFREAKRWASEIQDGTERRKTQGKRTDVENDPGPVPKRRWAILRIALGTGQVMGATLGLVLLLQTGVTSWTMGVVGATLGLAVLSRALFSSWSSGSTRAADRTKKGTGRRKK